MLNVATEGITSMHLQANSVGSDEILTDAVGQSEIAAKGVGPTDIAGLSIIGIKIRPKDRIWGF